MRTDETPPRFRVFPDEGPPAPEAAPRAVELTSELGMAQLMVTEHGTRLRYVPSWRRWYVWDGHRWAPDDTGEVARAAKDTARDLWDLAWEKAGDKELARAAMRAASAGGHRAIIELAGTEPGIALAPAQLDGDPYLLNTASGVVDLRTGELGPHDPAQHLTKVTTAGYDPAATAPTFERFLTRVQPDPEMRAFLARLLGYSLLGVVNEHVLPIFYGSGANGKSTLLDAVLGALGDYAGTADPGLLIERGDVHPTGLADLHGRRLVIGHETDKGRRLAEGTVKRLTGGDRIKARRMREDFWEFDPSHLLIMLTNHKPTVQGDDEGIWRRLRVVPFAVEIPEDERDGTLGERLAAERDGILAWMLAGLADYRAHGLDAPGAVAEATASYRAESDLLGTFLAEHCITGPHFHVYATELFEAWRAYCADENRDAGSQTSFGKTLTERGFERGRSGRKLYRGLALTADDDDGR